MSKAVVTKKQVPDEPESKQGYWISPLGFLSWGWGTPNEVVITVEEYKELRKLPQEKREAALADLRKPPEKSPEAEAAQA